MKKAKEPIRKRRPKGMGAITNLGSGRERPFMASMYDKPIGYFKTYREAEMCLLRHILKKYRMMPGSICGNETLEAAYTDFIYDLQQSGKLSSNIKYISDSDIDDYNSVFIHRIENNKMAVSASSLSVNKCPTFAEIWKIVFDDEIVLKSDSTQAQYKTAYKHLEALHNVPVNQIMAKDMQCILDDFVFQGYKKSPVNAIKIVCKYIFNYAIANGLISTDYTMYVKIKPIENNDTRIDVITKKIIPASKRIPFTQEEIAKLYHDNTDESRIVLIYIFTGMRPNEFLKMKSSDIDLKKHIMIGGSKTKNGLNRAIPIHDIIYPFIKELSTKANNNEYLLYPTVLRGTAYTKYRLEIYKPVMKRLNMPHNDTYDTRHTFADLCFYNHVDEYAKKKIMGHSITDLTLNVYTTASDEFLLDEINKIKIEGIC